MSTVISDRFPRYTEFNPSVPVWCVTPGLSGCTHRFFDTSPLSPSGRYLGLTRFRDDTRPPVPGEAAEIIVLDLQSGDIEKVAETKCFDIQLGAQVQWGADDGCLVFNDLDTSTWRPHIVELNPATGERREIEGMLYMLSPDGKRAASPCLLRTALTQSGYGAVVPPNVMPLNQRCDENDGLYITDLEAGNSGLLVSFRDIHDALAEHFDDELHREGAFYGFHVKWNPQGTRLLFAIRFRPMGGYTPGWTMPVHAITVKADGTDLRMALPHSLWRRGGHHPTWCPDGEYISQNLVLSEREGMQFVKYRYDGSDLQALVAGVRGSGHPSVHPDGRHLVTDTYIGDGYGDGTVPIRWVDLKDGTDNHIIRIQAKPKVLGPLNWLRVDPHPAWDRTHRYIAFNACPNGVRGVYLADLATVIGD